jgi:hypothetical protein
MNGNESVREHAEPTARQRLLRAVILIALLVVGRAWTWDHPIPVHGDEVGFIDGIGFPRPCPVHPPGYPLWVAMGTALNRLGVEPYTAFKIWAAIGSIVAPLCLYLGLRGVTRDGVAWWTALALGVCPLVWFLSTTALTYTAMLAIALPIVGSCRRALQAGDARAARRAVWWMLPCIWLRPDYLFWLGPLTAWSVWRHRAKGCGIALAANVLSVACLMVLVRWLYQPVEGTTAAAMSWSAWVESVYAISAFRLGWVDGLARSAAKLGGILTWVFGPAVPVLIVAAVCMRRWRRAGDLVFLCLWTLPLTVFVLLVHMSEPGHVILLAAAGYAVVAVFLDRFCRGEAAVRLASATAVMTALFFIWYPWSVQGEGWKRTLDAKIGYLSLSGLRQIDRRWDIHTPSDIWPTAVHRPTASRPAFHGQ